MTPEEFENVLQSYAFYFHADVGVNHMSWLHGGSRTIAGKLGARWSRLHREGCLRKEHYGVDLTKDESRPVTPWLDADYLEMPSFSPDRQGRERARQGKLVWPVMDVDPGNPLAMCGLHD